MFPFQGTFPPEAQNGIFLVAKNVPGQLPLALLKPPASGSQWRSWLAGRAWNPAPPTLLHLLCVFFPSSLPFAVRLQSGCLLGIGHAEARAASHCLPGGGSGGPAPQQPCGEVIQSPPAGPLRYALTLPF